MYFPALNSDDGINILMVHSFSIPENLYFWGQDRYGSFIPLLANPLLKIFSLRAEVAESVVHFGVLILGFFSFASFLKSRYIKILFALFFFFPPYHMIEFFRNNIGLSYCLVGIMLFLLHKIQSSEIKPVFKHFYYFLLALLTVFSVWLSELAAISIFILLIVFILKKISKKETISNFLRYKTELAYFIFTLATLIIFIRYAKINAIKIETFQGVNTLSEVINSLSIFFYSLFQLLFFKAKEPITGIYIVLLLFALMIFMFSKKKIELNKMQRTLLFFLITEVIAIFVAIMLSNWALLNNIPRRYFVGAYIFLGLASLIIFENTKFSHQKLKYLNHFVFIIILTGSISSFYNLIYVWPKTFRSKIEVVSEFRQLEPAGIIADYWNSYITACANPSLIKATPHDALEIRNKKMAVEVMEQDNIYVIRDGWLEFFPDTLIQFNNTLVKSGDAFILGNCNVCLYKKLPE